MQMLSDNMKDNSHILQYIKLICLVSSERKVRKITYVIIHSIMYNTEVIQIL